MFVIGFVVVVFVVLPLLPGTGPLMGLLGVFSLVFGAAIAGIGHTEEASGFVGIGLLALTVRHLRRRVARRFW